jgi:deoxycytidine triphosphate deaminase
MILLTGKHAATRLTGIVHPKYQVHRFSVHLTVRTVYAVDPTGEVDFGGNEYVAADRIAVATQRRRSEDRYEWWELARGCYFVEFNEALNLADDEIGLLEPEQRLLRAGAAHVTTTLRGHVEPIETLLSVDTLRLLLKQNARISRVRVFRLTPAGSRAAAGGKRTTRRLRPPAETKSPRG